MRKLRPKEVQDRTTRKWWNKMTSGHKFVSTAEVQRSPQTVGAGAGVWSQAWFQSLPAVWPLSSAASCTLWDRAICSLPLEYITAKNHIVCKYPLSVFSTTNPRPSYSLREAFPAVSLRSLARMGHFLPSLHPHRALSVSLSGSLPVPALNYSSTHAPLGEVVVWVGPVPPVTDTEHVLMESINVSFMWLNSFSRYFMYLICPAQDSKLLKNKDQIFYLFYIFKNTQPGPDTQSSL